MAAGARYPHGLLVVVHADRAGVESREIASDTATHIERQPQALAPKVPSVWRLHVQQALPPRALERRQAGGVFV
jgi:hypothetical protein